MLPMSVIAVGMIAVFIGFVGLASAYYLYMVKKSVVGAVVGIVIAIIGILIIPFLITAVTA
ncbi:MAG: hypothetical protein SPI77_02535 [Corynebacterium sp.]|nr:hypothetical protein [Corynebacterium sp.]